MMNHVGASLQISRPDGTPEGPHPIRPLATTSTLASHPWRLVVLALGLVVALPGIVSATPLTIQGWVKTTEGTGIAGARIELLPIRSDFEVERLLLARHAAPEPVATTTSEASGRFVLEAPAVGIWRVAVRAPGFVPMRYFALPLAESRALPPVTLSPAIPAPIQAVGAAAAPVVGAAVVVRSSTPSLWSEMASVGWRIDGRIGWTDENGSITVARARGEQLDVSVFAPGQSAARRSVRVERAIIKIDSDPDWQRLLEVRSPQGEPVPGVLVAIGKLAWPIGLTGSDGRLELAANEKAPQVVHLLTADGRHQVVRLRPPSNGEEDPAVFTLHPAPRFSGRIVSAADGRPVAGALVWPANRSGAFVLSDREGRFGWSEKTANEKVAPEWRVRAMAPGFLPLSLSVEPAAPNATAPTLKLEPAAAIRGQVVDAHGAPLAGVTLEALPTSEAQMRHALHPDWIDLKSLSDAAGRFELRQLDPKGTYQLAAAKEGFTTVRLAVDRLEPLRTRDLERIALQRGRLLYGAVKGLDEQPIADAEVKLLAPVGPSADAPPASRTNAAGRFEMLGYPAPSFDIVTHAKGFAPFTVRGVHLPRGMDPVDLGTLMLAPGETIHGVVRDPAGSPIAGAGVWIVEELALPALQRAPDRDPDAVADAAGRFAVEDLTADHPAHLICDHPGFLVASIRGVTAPTPEPITVVLKPGSTVSGRVVDVDGRPIPGSEVSLSPRDPPPDSVPPTPRGEWRRTVVSDDRGEFALEDVASGPAAIAAFAEGFQPAEIQNLEIAERATLEGLRLVLARGNVLEGWISTEDGEPLAEATVQIGPNRASSDTDGNYRVSGIPSGLHKVDVRREGYNRITREIEIEIGAQHVDFVLAGGRRVAGRAVDDADTPVAGVRIQLSLDDDLEAQEHSALTEADGSFAWPRVADGHYHLHAAKEGFVAVADDGVRVHGQPVEDLEIRLRQGAAIVGRVVGLEALELARLEIRAESDEHPPRHGEVDYASRFEVADLGPGDWLIKAWVAGGSRQAEARVSLEPGVAEVERDLEFGAGLRLTGHVLYGGEPLPGTSVRFLGLDVAADRSVETDFAGDFRLEDLETGRYRIELVNQPERLIYNEDLELLADRDLTIEIQASRIRGTVVSAADSQPLADALIAMQQLVGPSHTQEASLFTFSTDQQGFFSQDRLTAGWYRLTARKNGYEPVVQLLEVPTGFDLDPIQFALEPTDGLEVVVRLASGRTTQVATGVALDATGRPAWTETRVLDPAGYARFDTLPPGTWNLLVSAPGGATTRATVTIPGPPVEIILPDAGRLRVRIPALVESNEVAILALTGQDGRPFHHLSFAGELQQQWPLVAGKTTLEGLPAGIWALRAVTPDGQAWVGSATTTGGPDIEVNLE